MGKNQNLDQRGKAHRKKPVKIGPELEHHRGGSKSSILRDGILGKARAGDPAHFFIQPEIGFTSLGSNAFHFFQQLGQSIHILWLLILSLLLNSSHVTLESYFADKIETVTCDAVKFLITL